MARKSKRMILNEAIRQGQAKIAEGLKTGQMRADNLPAQENPRDNELALDDIAPGRAGFLRSKKKSIIREPLSYKAKLILLSCVAVLVLGIWFVATLINPEPSVPPDSPAASGSLNESDASEEIESVQERMVRETGTEVPLPVVSTGDNVICIQTIALSRKDELAPIAEFFRGKGIETEIIAVSGKAVLVTKVGFEQNPVKKGTDGYKLFQRIKQLGTVYVEETKDTKFGVKPFQDVYGHKR